MYIGEVSKLSGVTVKAIRHYEKIGLIPTPARKGKYRIYSEGDVNIIKMIKTAQSLGFSLRELKEVVQIKAKSGEFPYEYAYQLIMEKNLEIDNKINNLKNLKKDLSVFKKKIKDL